MSVSEKLKIVGIAGSLREGSYNRALLRAARELAPEGVEIEIAEIGDFPLYNGDVEAQGMPEAVQRVAAQLARADAVLLVTPEYNYSVSGVLKNAIDWISRAPEAPMKEKPVSIMGASMGILGTARAQYHLRQTLLFLQSHVLNGPEVFVARAREKFDESGRLVDEATREHVAKHVAALAAWARRLQR